MVGKKEKSKTKKKMGVRTAYVLTFFVLAFFSFIIYLFSFESKTHILACSGNYYYTDQEIYSIAGVDTNTRLWITPSFWLEYKLEHDDLIKNAEVKKSNGKMVLNIEEKVVIGYYVDGEDNYLFTSDNESIKADSSMLDKYIHFPCLNGFNEKQRKEIAEQFKEHKNKLTRSVIEKIAEMSPYQNTYDDDMVELVMADGNRVYSSMDDLVMLCYYQSMLQDLQGESVCLVLDAENSVISKLDCSEMNQEYWEAKEAAKKSAENNQDTGETTEEEEPQDVVDPNEVEGVDDSAATWDESGGEESTEVQDWYLDSNSGLYYSPSLNLYRDNTGQVYSYDANSGYYTPVN